MILTKCSVLNDPTLKSNQLPTGQGFASLVLWVADLITIRLMLFARLPSVINTASFIFKLDHYKNNNDSPVTF